MRANLADAGAFEVCRLLDEITRLQHESNGLENRIVELELEKREAQNPPMTARIRRPAILIDALGFKNEMDLDTVQRMTARTSKGSVPMELVFALDRPIAGPASFDGNVTTAHVTRKRVFKYSAKRQYDGAPIYEEVIDP